MNKLLLLILLMLFFDSQCFLQTRNTQQSNKTKILWPLPQRISFDQSSPDIQFDFSDIEFKIQSLGRDLIVNIIDHYLTKVFHTENKIISEKNQKTKQGILFNIVVKNSIQKIPQTTEHEKYQLTIRNNGNWQLIADYFPGFVRGFQTFSQLIQKQISGRYKISGTPILIDDQPQFFWRGLMIDTSRHFLPVSKIIKIIDGLMYNKMNTLHWHIVDQDSFPMQIPSRPQLSNSGSFGKTYKPSDLIFIQDYANSRAIRVIPQYDTPAHTRSWGLSPQLSKIIFQGEDPYEGQFDPTNNLTYHVVLDVAKHVNNIFKDKYVHLGGDEVDFDVWEEHPEIKQWMKRNDIQDYDGLQIYYRKRQRQLLRSINGSKKAIYWANQQIDLPVDQNDVIQWWGDTQNLDQIKTRKNQIILSNYDLTYLDIGFGDPQGDSYDPHISWRDMYKFNPKIEGVNVIGGEACMWAQLTYEGNIEQKVWIRSSAIAQRLWNMNVDGKQDILNIVERLVSQKNRMKLRGFKVSPVTVGLCEKSPEICFS